MLKKIATWLGWKDKQALPLRVDNYWIAELTEHGKTERVSTRVVGYEFFGGDMYFKLEGYGCDSKTYYRNEENGDVVKLQYSGKDIWAAPKKRKLFTKPVQDEIQYHFLDDLGREGQIIENTTADDSVINGYQCTSIMEEEHKLLTGEVVYKTISYWGDGIGYIKVQYFQPNDNGALYQYKEQTLVESKFW